MIDLLHVSKNYGSVAAVRDVSLSLATGQVVGLLGPNGAGKSTIIKMIACLLAPTSGSVRVGGFDTIDDAHAARSLIGYLPEFAPLYHEMTAEGYLRYRAGLYPGGLARDAIEQAIVRCQLTEMRSRRISALSKGYRQRVGLAAAILHNPRVVILDEPTTGLDPAQIRESRELFRSLAKDKLVMLSSHILPEIESTCDRVIIIAQGRVRADGSPAQLLASATQSADTIAEVDAEDIGMIPMFATALTEAGARQISIDGPRLRITPHTNPYTPDIEPVDIRHVAAHIARELGITLLELHTPKPTLEQVFLRVINQGDAPARATLPADPTDVEPLPETSRSEEDAA